MARRTLDNARFLKYKHGTSGLTVWQYGNGVSFDTSGEGVDLSPSQARHTAKKLLRLADNIEGVKKTEAMTCKDCGHKLFLTSIHPYEMEVEPDQEPYTADVSEPVMIGGEVAETVFVEMHAIAHVCPGCKVIRDIEINENP